MSSDGAYGRHGFNANASGYGGSSYSSQSSGGGYAAPSYGGGQGAYGASYSAPGATSYAGAQYGQQPGMESFQVRIIMVENNLYR